MWTAFLRLSFTFLHLLSHTISPALPVLHLTLLLGSLFVKLKSIVREYIHQQLLDRDNGYILFQILFCRQQLLPGYSQLSAEPRTLAGAGNPFGTLFPAQPFYDRQELTEPRRMKQQFFSSSSFI